MGDKFSKVKRFGVIMGREFWGFWMARATAAWRWQTGHSIQHSGRGAKWVWAKVTAAFLFGWALGRVVVVPAQAGVRRVCLDGGRRWGAGELGGLIGKAGGYGRVVRPFRWLRAWIRRAGEKRSPSQRVDSGFRRNDGCRQVRPGHSASAAANRFRLAPE